MPSASKTVTESSTEEPRIRLSAEGKARVEAAAERFGQTPGRIVELAVGCLEDATLTGRLDPIALASADLNRGVDMLEVSATVNAAAVNRLAEIMGRANVGMLREIRAVAASQFSGVAK